MTAQETLAALGLADYEEKLSPHWEVSQQTLPDTIPWLEPDFVREACRETYVYDDVAQAAARTARRVADDPRLRALAWHMHSLVYVHRTADWGDITHWPDDLHAALGEDAACFYLLIVLSNLPQMQAEHRRRGIPADVIRDTVLDMKLWFDTKRERTGEAVPNLGPVMVAWLSNHFRAGLYRLVRLQFQFADFHYPLHVFRHRDSRAVLALSSEGVRFRADGQRARSDEDTAWTSAFDLRDGRVVGHPILPTGRALPKEAALPTSEWEHILAPGDPVFNLHIPGGEPMTHAGCGDSFRLAMEFFPRHYPDYPYRVFCCGSWILNSWLEEVLPPESNLVRFQREVYLFPIPQWPPSMYDRVFGLERLPEDLSQLPRQTGLQRAIVEAVESGRGVGGGAGGCLLFPEDFRWGEEVYRRQKLPFQL